MPLRQRNNGCARDNTNNNRITCIVVTNGTDWRVNHPAKPINGVRHQPLKFFSRIGQGTTLGGTLAPDTQQRH